MFRMQKKSFEHKSLKVQKNFTPISPFWNKRNFFFHPKILSATQQESICITEEKKLVVNLNFSGLTLLQNLGSDDDKQTIGRP